MRITKRQLKRIIREECSRILKGRRQLREAAGAVQVEHEEDDEVVNGRFHGGFLVAGGKKAEIIIDSPFGDKQNAAVAVSKALKQLRLNPAGVEIFAYGLDNTIDDGFSYNDFVKELAGEARSAEPSDFMKQAMAKKKKPAPRKSGASNVAVFEEDASIVNYDLELGFLSDADGMEESKIYVKAPFANKGNIKAAVQKALNDIGMKSRGVKIDYDGQMFTLAKFVGELSKLARTY